MSQDSLYSFYRNEYEQVHAAGLATIRCDRDPYDRFEASVYYLSRLIRGGDILELGAGNGLTARSLLELDVPFTSYTLTDYTADVHQRFEGLFDDPRMRVLQMDGDHLPDVKQQYDVVVMVALIEHLVDPLGAMRRIATMLRPNGFVYIDTPNMAKYTRRLKLLAGRFPSTASHNEGLTTHDGNRVSLYDEGHLHYFTFRSLSLMLTDYCGFARVEKLPYFTGRKLLGRRSDNMLARMSPELFSELCVAAHV